MRVIWKLSRLVKNSVSVLNCPMTMFTCQNVEQIETRFYSGGDLVVNIESVAGVIVIQLI